MTNYETNNNREFSANRRASIRTRVDRTGKLRTETVNRDSGIDLAVTTDTRNNSTKVFIDLAGRSFGSKADIVLDGREALTVYRTLQRHFEYQGKGYTGFLSVPRKRLIKRGTSFRGRAPSPFNRGYRMNLSKTELIALVKVLHDVTKNYHHEFRHDSERMVMPDYVYKDVELLIRCEETLSGEKHPCNVGSDSTCYQQGVDLDNAAECSVKDDRTGSNGHRPDDSPYRCVDASSLHDLPDQKTSEGYLEFNLADEDLEVLIDGFLEIEIITNIERKVDRVELVDYHGEIHTFKVKKFKPEWVSLLPANVKFVVKHES